MNIQEYQIINLYSKYQCPENLKNDLHQLISFAEYSGLNTPSAINIYNILCGIEALLCRYETISRETLLSIEMAEDFYQCRQYLLRLHQNALHQKIYNPKMMFRDSGNAT